MQSKEYGAKKIFISSIIISQSIEYRKILEINEKLKDKCKVNGFVYIDNGNITSENLWKDGTYLNETGSILLANNFIDYLKDFLYQIPWTLIPI